MKDSHGTIAPRILSLYPLWQGPTLLPGGCSFLFTMQYDGRLSHGPTLRPGRKRLFPPSDQAPSTTYIHSHCLLL